MTYAEVAILRTDPVAHTPPTEESEVYLATPVEAAHGYGLDRMSNRLDIGLLRNGGTQFAGRSAIDLDFLLGKNGGHLNVNGIAGLGTKSTLLLIVNWLLLREARIQPGTAKGDDLELWLLLVEKYEEAEFPIALPDPVAAIRFRMEQAKLQPKDLVPYIGSKSKVLEVLSGQRPLSLTMIRNLMSGLGIPAEVLLQKRG